MLNAKWILQNKEAFLSSWDRRNFTFDFQSIENLESERLQLIEKSEKLQADRNKIAKEIGLIKSNGGDVSSLLGQSIQIKDALPRLLDDLRNIEEQINTIISSVPNILENDVPSGKDEQGNIEIAKYGVPRQFTFHPKPHNEIGEGLGLMDFETAAKVSGSRFVFLKSHLAKMERSLVNFMLEHNSKHGYTEVSPPYLTNAQAFFGTGQLPKFEGDFFKTTDGRYLIPTSEVTLTNMFAGEIMQEHQLPIRITAATPCFRSEAGSAGKDTTGMIRQHQFMKVELVTIASEDISKQEHEKMLVVAEEILQKLELPYRIVILCGGDIGFGAQKTYDIEVWIPSQNKYREISSISNMGSFQARRMSARYKKAGENTTTFVHTLNGSSLAVGRTLVAILENYQNEDGSVTVPKVLQGLMGTDIIKSLL